MDGRGRLNADFVEWMMGAPPDWTANAKRSARLRMLGNAVFVPCAMHVGLVAREILAAQGELVGVVDPTGR